MTHVCVHLQQSFRSPLSAPPGLCTHRTRCMLACRLWLPSAPACTRSSLTLQSPSHAVMSLSRFACRKALITTGANALSCFCVFKLPSLFHVASVHTGHVCPVRLAASRLDTFEVVGQAHYSRFRIRQNQSTPVYVPYIALLETPAWSLFLSMLNASETSNLLAVFSPVRVIRTCRHPHANTHSPTPCLEGS